MTEFDLGKVVGDKGDKGDTGNTGATGNGISSIELLSTSGKNKTYRITYTNGNHFDYVVADGADGEATIVTSWETTLSDTKVPSEKLVKTDLDKKISTSSTSGLVKNDGSIDTNTYLTSSSLSNYMQKSSTAGLMKNDGTVDTNTYLTISSLSNYMQKSSTSGLMKNDGTVDTNTYLTSSSLSNYVQKSNTTGLLKNDGTVDTTSYSTFSGAYSDLSGKPTIPSKISDLTNDSDFIETSSTAGLVKNDGSIDTTSYLSSLPSHTHGAINNNGTMATANRFVVTDGSKNIALQEKLGNITLDGKVGTTSGKPLITTTGGTVTTGAFGTSSGQFAEGNHTHSGYVSATKVTSWSSTTSDSNVPSEKLVKDSLDSINTLIGNAISYINL